MSETTASQPGVDHESETIDQAVRAQLDLLLTAGTKLLNSNKLMARLDPISLFPAVLRTSMAAASRPDRMAGVATQAAADMLRATAAASVRAFGGTSAYQPKHANDKRFADPAWSGNAAYWLVREIYHGWAQSLLAIVRDADTPREVRQKAEFAVQLMIDALAPTNFVLGNPAVIKKA